ncbi:hypothetical protein V8P79_16140 [Acinetobacter baumannii]
MNINFIKLKNLVRMLSLGMASGFVFGFIGTTLQAYYAHSNKNILFISILPLISTPYIIKFLWASLFDNIEDDDYWSWIINTIIIIIVLFLILFLTNQNYLAISTYILLTLGFTGATLDILIDTYLIKKIKTDELKIFLPAQVTGWRISSVLTGGAIIYIFDSLKLENINQIYLIGLLFYILNLLMLVIIDRNWNKKTITQNFKFILLISLTPSLIFIKGTITTIKKIKKNSLNNIKEPKILTFVILYKSSDLIQSILLITFFLKNLDLSLKYYSITNVIIGLTITILGGFVWSKLNKITSKPLEFSLYSKILSIILLMMISKFERNTVLFLFPVILGISIVSSGFMTYAFTEFLIKTIDKKNAAFEYSIVTALSNSSKFIFAPVVGFIALNYGWDAYFIFALFFSFFTLYFIKNNHKLFK